MDAREFVAGRSARDLQELRLAVDREMQLIGVGASAGTGDMQSKAMPLGGQPMTHGSAETSGSAINRFGEVALHNVDDCFTYHAPSGLTLDSMNQVREASIALAKTILRQVPGCPDRSMALRKLREARMWANSALALGGRF